MTAETVDRPVTQRWYSRPVLFGIAELRREIIERSVPNKISWWGYDVIQIDDPDGNELLFPFE